MTYSNSSEKMSINKMNSLRVNTVSYIKKNHTNETNKIFCTNKKIFTSYLKRALYQIKLLMYIVIDSQVLFFSIISTQTSHIINSYLSNNFQTK